MTKLLRRWGLVLLLAASLASVSATPAQAADPVTLQLEAPQKVRLGDTITVAATLRDGKGSPIPRANIILWVPTSFLGTGGSMRLAEGSTDAQGRAVFSYQLRSEGTLTLNAYFPGDNRYAPAQGSAELTVQPGSGQLHQETAGVRVPGVGVWLLLALLGTIWSVYFTVMLLLTFVARGSSKAT